MPSSAGGGGDPSTTADVLLEKAASASVDELLQLVRRYAGVDVAFVGEFSAGRRIIRFVRGEGPAAATLVDRSHELGASYCRLIVDRSVPPLIGDVGDVPQLRTLAVTAELDIASYIGVPIRLSGGDLYGTLCGFGHEPCHEWPDGLLKLLEVAAELIAERLEAPQHRFLDVLAVQDRIRAVLSEPASFSIVYQPIVELDSERVVGFEALSRFPGRSPEPPDVWFADAHQVGLGVELEMLAATRAAEGFDWAATDSFLSVNLCAASICEGALGPLLERCDPSRLVLELTEGQPHQDLLSSDTRERLRGAEVRLAVDDLGAGFAGLSRLVEIEPDVIKLDRFLTMGVGSDPRRAALAAAALHLRAALDVELIAEGVETEHDREALLALGMPLGQGFLLGRPAPLPPR